MRKRPTSVAAYIAAAPPRARPMLRQLRAVVRRTVPSAQESISYGMPYYSFNGRLAYFAAFRAHVSYFVMGSTTRISYASALRPYLRGRATLQFPLGTKIPVGLIQRLLRDRVKAIRARTK